MYLRALICLGIIGLQIFTAASGAVSVPNGGTQLKFSDLFSGPIGNRGLVISDKARRLDGQKVQVFGYMVRQDEAVPGIYLLAPVPVQVDRDHYGLADDLPLTTIYVFDRAAAKSIVPYKRGPVLVSGTLRIGNREEADGRISIFRLELEPASPIQRSPLHKNSKTQPGRNRK